MDQDLTALLTRLIDPITHRLKLWFQSVDTVVTHAFNIQNLDATLSLFMPQRTMSSRSFPRNEMRSRSRSMIRSSRIVPSMRGHMMRRRYQRTLAYRNNVRDTESMKHIHVRRMIPINGACQLNTDPGAKEKQPHKFPKYKNGSTRLGKLPSNRGSLNHD